MHYSSIVSALKYSLKKYRLVKIASVKLNYLIGIGAIILYIDVIVQVIPTKDPDVVNVFCNLTPWLTAIGYSLSYGTILAKMARIYYIFIDSFAKKTVRKDDVFFKT